MKKTLILFSTLFLLNTTLNSQERSLPNVEVKTLKGKTFNIQNLENNADEFALYPNPAQNVLNIEGIFESIEIYDVFGKLVFASDEKSEINIAGLANGSYYVNILTSNAVIKKKVTVAR